MDEPMRTPREPGSSRPAREPDPMPGDGEFVPATDAPPICDLCGNVMIERHCRLVCPVCGYQRDCSDP